MELEKNLVELMGTIGIDASNIREGGCLVHLKEILACIDPGITDRNRVVVWSGRRTLERLKVEKPNIEFVHVPDLDKSLAHRKLWQDFKLPDVARKARCDVLFNPGGANLCSFRPLITMSRNLLPFDPISLSRYGWSRYRLHYRFLRTVQTRSFKNASGIIFLNKFAQDTILKFTGQLSADMTIIPHGISECFHTVGKARMLKGYSLPECPKVIYVSTVDRYKHQLKVVKAVQLLQDRGFDIALELYGRGERKSLNELVSYLENENCGDRNIQYCGESPHSELANYYQDTDVFVFASECENMPNILLEGMASGLPIVSSDRGPMPSILRDAGLYCDPTDYRSVAEAIEKLLKNQELRKTMACRAYEYAQSMSWKTCSNRIFEYVEGFMNRGKGQ